MDNSFNLHVPSGAQQTVFFLGDPIASSATPDIGATTGDYVHITGVTPIVGFTESYPGRVVTVVFDGILTLVNSASLILPSGADITTAVGDAAMFRSESATVWRCVFYERADGTAIAGTSGFLTGLNTSVPNATVNVAYLLATGGTTNKDVTLIPTGTGGFLLAIPDNTATGGNKRGNYAVDVQLSRSVNTQVASGNYSFLAGRESTASGSDSVVIGRNHTVSGDNSAVIAGQANAITGTYSAIVGGISHAVNFNYSGVFAGQENTANGHHSAVVAGQKLTVGNYSLGFNASSNGGLSVGLSSFTQSVLFNDATLSVGNTDGVARAIRLWMPNTDGSYSGAFYTAFKAQTQTANITYTLPVADGTSGQVLTTDGTGGLSWSAAGGGTLSYTEVTGTSQAMAVNHSYGANNAALVTNTLPATAAVGDEIEVVGIGAGGWLIAQNASQTIVFNSTTSTTAGVGGSVASQDRYDTIRLKCIVANTTWLVIWSKGTFTVV